MIAPQVVCGTVLSHDKESKDDFTPDSLVLGMVTPIDDKPQELIVTERSDPELTLLLDKALCLPITTI